jgi:hypothetical protein
VGRVNFDIVDLKALNYFYVRGGMCVQCRDMIFETKAKGIKRKYVVEIKTKEVSSWVETQRPEHSAALEDRRLMIIYAVILQSFFATFAIDRHGDRE